VLVEPATHPQRRRGHRRRRLGQRSRDHRRIRAGHPRSGGDRSAVTGGTQVLSDWIKVRITAAQGSTFLDRMIALVEGAERQKTPNEIALNILLAGLTIIFVFAVATIPSFAPMPAGHHVGLVLVALFVT
jgi:K+-transporting ATPase ATPase B chain